MTRAPKIPGKVSIGIPTRNRSAFAVRAVRSALSQSYEDVEVLLSDNCSTDDTLRRIHEVDDARLVVLKQTQNIGMVANFNACLAAATGELFLMLSDDDLLELTAVERLAAPFLSATNGLAPGAIGLTWCPCCIINSEGARLWMSVGGPETEPPLDLVLGLFNGIRGPRFCSIMTRTDDAISVGGYDDKQYGPLCDMGNWTRVALRYSTVVCINEPLARYTMHGSSETSQAAVHEWQCFAENINEDLIQLLRERGDEAGQRMIQTAGTNNISNGIVTILLQQVAKPGQIRRVLCGVFHSRRYLLTPFVIKRLIREGWKLSRLWRQHSP